jgi:molecular chaperone GrpE
MNHHDEVVAPDRAATDEPMPGNGPNGPPLPGEPISPEIIDEAAGATSAGSADISVEDLIEQLEQVTSERDGHFDARARLQAEFDNYRKRVLAQQSEQAERAAEGLVTKLLPVLDACDAALAHGAKAVGPIAQQLMVVLEREGLIRLDPTDQPFDPEFHEAVMHEAGEGAEPTVVEVLRTGYQWKSRVIRPAMVKVRG